MRLFKGVAQGTYWDLHRPGPACHFTSMGGPTDIDAIVRHITHYSAPSAFLSFSASFAIACDYALSGGAVYEVDLAQLRKVRGSAVVDPAREIITASPSITKLTRPSPTHHDGHQPLLGGIANRSGRILSASPHRPGFRRGGGPAAVTVELRAMIWALRDAEILVAGNVPFHCVVQTHAVP